MDGWMDGWIDRVCFRGPLRHPVRKLNGSILSTPEPARGLVMDCQLGTAVLQTKPEGRRSLGVAMVPTQPPENA